MARKKSAKRAKKQIKSRKKRPFFAYPLFIFLLLCAGIFLIAWTLRAGASDIFVTAKVSAPFVTQSADITSPADGAHFTAIPITVSGDCPANAGYVEIFRDSVMAGTAICSNSAYSLEVDLLPGANSLTAHVFNITDDEGPVSSPVKVYYDVPKPPPGTGSQTGNPGTSSPLSLRTAFIYKGYHVGDKLEWPLELSGGIAPYAVSIDWGDGTGDLLSRAQAGQFNISHTYSRPGGDKNSFTIKVRASDNSGNAAYLQFFVIVTPNSIAQSAGNIFSKPPPKIGGLNWLYIAWPAYALVVLMTVSYLLGEREELLILRKKGLLRR